MPEVIQTNSSKVQSIHHECASEFTATPKGDLFCKFCCCSVKSDKSFMVDAHLRCAKHQQGSFHETKSSQTFLKHALQILQINYFLFHFNRKKTIRFVF